MKKSKALFLLAASLLIGCANQPGGDVPSTDSSSVATDIRFSASEFEVRSGTCLTVEGAPQGVTYSFQGGTPDGVSLDANTGLISFDEEGPTIPSKVYLASFNGKKASCVVKFFHAEEVPTVTFDLDSSYLIQGDVVVAKALGKGGKEYAVRYELEEEVPGVSIDASTGKVSFTDSLPDGTPFTVVASSKGASAKRSYKAMTQKILTADSKEAVLEKGTPHDVSYQILFNGNELEGTLKEGDLTLLDENRTPVPFGFEANQITLSQETLKDLDVGSHHYRLITPRNALTLSVSVATKILYTADDIEEAFEPNYQEATPSFKEGSLEGYYVLGADIDLSSALKEGGSLYHDGQSFLPIGAYSDGAYNIPFTGTFDGNGHTISSFSYVSSDIPVMGFFGNNQGTIKNLTLEGKIPAKSWSGGLVGNNFGTIEGVICDLELQNGGQSATGVFASVNHGLISDCFSVNPNVNGFNEGEKNYQNSGIIVGLNDVEGKLDNVYGISSDPDTKLMGWTLNEEATEESVGKKFSSKEEMLAYDFSSFSSPYVSWTSEGPKNNVLFVSPFLQNFGFASNLPSFLLKGQEMELRVEAMPVEHNEAVNALTTYSIVGEAHGMSLEGNRLSAANYDGTSPSVTLKAQVKWKGQEYEATKTISLYSSLEGIEIANTESSIIAGLPLRLTYASTPDIHAEATYSIDWDSLGWKKNFVHLNGDVLTLDEDAPSPLTEVAVRVEVLGKRSAYKVFPVTHTTGLENGYQIHDEGEEKPFEFVLPAGEKLDKAYDGSTLLEAEQAVQEGDKVTISGLDFSKDLIHDLMFITESGLSYRAHAAKRNEAKTTLESLQTQYGNDLVVISSMEDFKTHFATDGGIHKELSDSMKKVYALNCDLDFAGESISPLGYQMLGTGEGQSALFEGKFFGLNHKIKNFQMNKTLYGAGLFFQVEGSVQDLVFEDVSIALPSGNFAGLLCGFFGGEAKATNIQSIRCSVSIGDAIPANPGDLCLGGIAGKDFSNKGIAYSSYNGYGVHLSVKK